MKLAVYTLAYNEEKIIHHFINHYKQFCNKIVVYDNMSTDNTKRIAEEAGCEVIQWEAPGGGLNDQSYLDIKQECYKNDQDYDYVMVTDCDEYFTHSEGVQAFVEYLKKCKKEGITVPKVQGFNMVGDVDSTTIPDIIQGVPSKSYSKRCIFKPTLNMKWTFGCHPQHSQGLLDATKNVIESPTTEIHLLHYKYINLKYVIDRHRQYSERLSNFNKDRGLAVHYDYGVDVIEKEYADIFKSSIKVIKNGS